MEESKRQWPNDIHPKTAIRNFVAHSFLCSIGVDSFVIASLGSTVRGFKLDGDEHQEAMVPVGGAGMSSSC